MEIGSIFSLKSSYIDAGHSPQNKEENSSLFYSLCREALLVIAWHLKDSNKRVLLPAYTCQTVIDPFVESGWTVDFYNITKQLRIDKKDLIDKSDSFTPSLCVVHPYCGADLRDDELDALLLCKKNGCVMVEDLTQCIFSKQYSEIFDFFVGSYRKWFPIPDGAFLIGEGINSVDMTENTDFVQLMSDAMYLRGIYNIHKDPNVKEISRRVGNMALKHISGKIAPHKMSDFSNGLLSKEDWELVQSRRMSNYSFLYDTIRNLGYCHSVDRKMDEISCAPLFFPIYAENRSELQSFLAKKEIFAPVLWPVYSKSAIINDDISYIYNHILMLPCDQRYSREDMERIVFNVKNFNKI